MNSGYYSDGFGIFSWGGNPEQDYRNAMRGGLEKKGFIWNKTSGVPADQMWNIDNWPTKNLENIMEAYRVWGSVIADLHNEKAFNPSNTQHFENIRAVVEARQAPDTKRSALEALGFIWNKTAGNPANQMWNMDNWPEANIDNIMAAYQLYGDVIVQLHNTKQFSPGNTSSMAKIRAVVEANQPTGGGTYDNNPGGSVNAGDNNAQSSGNQGVVPDTQNLPAWAIPAGVTGIALMLFAIIR